MYRGTTLVTWLCTSLGSALAKETGHPPEVARVVPGCTEHLAVNYNPNANQDDGSCTDVNPCLKQSDSGDGTQPCLRCDTGEGLDRFHFTSGNDGFRSDQYDQLAALHVADGAIAIDGDLRDWAFVPEQRKYSQVPFAKLNGEVVVFENYQQGKWYGDQDFSTTAMLAWDSDFLYLAVDVVDDTWTVSKGTCFANGMQVAFEVGGHASTAQDGSSLEFMLQARRSADPTISRLHLINLGMAKTKTTCVTHASQGRATAPGAGARECCVHYEHYAGERAWMQLTDVAVLRNENNGHTVYEVAFSKLDLLGTSGSRLQAWAAGLTFGFSYLVNDGDSEATQQGWSGYYPHAIVHGWNNGEKQPEKAGTVILAPALATSSLFRPGGSVAQLASPNNAGFATGTFFLGMFVAVLLAVCVYFTFTAHQQQEACFNPTFVASARKLLGLGTQGGL